MGDLERRMSAQTSITRIRGVTKGDAFVGWDHYALAAQSKMLDQHFETAKLAHDGLITTADITEAEITEHQTAHDRIESIYLSARIAIDRRLGGLEEAKRIADQNGTAATVAPHTATSNSAQSDARMVELLESIRLDAMRITKFDGDRNKWLKFFEDFKINVHEKAYPNTLKLSQLRECLTGTALRVIDAALPANGDTYNGAWAALIERYDNKRFLVNSHLNSIFDFKLNGKHDIMRLVDTYEATIRALKSLEVNTDGWDAILSYMVLKRVDDASRTAWEMKQEDSRLPTFDSLLTFLKRRANSLDFASMGQSETRPPNHHKGKPLVHNVTTNGANEASCLFCNENHRSASCPQLFATPLHKRFSLVKKVKDLCYNCLQKGHFASTCKGSVCRACQGKHHTALCRNATATTAYSNMAIMPTSPSVNLVAFSPTTQSMSLQSLPTQSSA